MILTKGSMPGTITTEYKQEKKRKRPEQDDQDTEAVAPLEAEEAYKPDLHSGEGTSKISTPS